MENRTPARRPVRVALVLAAALAWAAAPARGVIRAPTQTMDAATSVVVGKVGAVDPANGVIEVVEAEATRGPAAPAAFRLKVINPPELLAEAAAGQPVVLFRSSVGAALELAAISVADRWVLASAKPTGGPVKVWPVKQAKPDLAEMFPGRTAALARVAREMKAGGKPTLLNAVDNKVFQGGVKELGRLPGVSKPAAIAAADVNGDKKVDVLVTTAAGGAGGGGGGGGAVKLFLANGAAFEDATAAWGLAGATGPRAAFGDVDADGKPDLLLGKALLRNDGRAFAPVGGPLAVRDDAPALAVALSDATGDGKPDALLLLATGTVHAFENPGAAGQAWKAQPARKPLWDGGGAAAAPSAAFFGDFGDTGRPHVLAVREAGVTRYALDPDGGPPADYVRLTGQKVDAHYKDLGAGFRNAAASVLDVNGDKRPDLFVVADGGSALLVNRGFGAFLVNPDAAAALAKPPPGVTLTPATPTAAADVGGDGFDDLLVLTDDGRLLLVDNPPLATHP